MDDVYFGSKIDPLWALALSDVKAVLRSLEAMVQAETASGYTVLPAKEHIMRAFTTPFNEVKVVIVGQDPYPNESHPVGLSFSVARGVKIPRSLENIYTELQADLNITPPNHGDLSSWQEQGVMLLNRILTVRCGESLSHINRGWEIVTAAAIKALAQRKQPAVGILWGNEAKKLTPLFGDMALITSAHPSPLSARRGFFGSKPFSRANALLEQQGATKINWEIK